MDKNFYWEVRKLGLYMNTQERDIFQNKQAIAHNQAYFQTNCKAEAAARQKQQMDTVIYALSNIQKQQGSYNANRQEMMSILKNMQHSSQKQDAANETLIKEMQDNKQICYEILSVNRDTDAALIKQINDLKESNEEVKHSVLQQHSAATAFDGQIADVRQAILATQILQQQTLAELAAQYRQVENLHEQKAKDADTSQQWREQQEASIQAHLQLTNDDLRIQQKTLSERVEAQEAAVEKLLRQVTRLREVIYERTGHLADKMEEGFRLSSAFAYHLLTRKDQPISMLVNKEK